MSKYEYYFNQLPPKNPKEKWSDEQRLALYARGENIIVSAGAGSGKTAVLTERILQMLLNGTHIDNIIVLTFTNDAATEMKERVRENIKNNISNFPILEKELLALDSAHIQTFDSFAFSIVKEYNYLLNLPENISIGDKNFLKMIREKILDEVFDESYGDIRFQNLIKKYTIKDDYNLKKIIHIFYEKALLEIDTREYLLEYIDNHFSDSYFSFIKEAYLNIINDKYQIIKDMVKELNLLDLGPKKDQILESIRQIETVYPAKTFEDFKRIENILEIKNAGNKSKKDTPEESELKDKVNGLVKNLNTNVNSLKELVAFNSLDEAIQSISLIKEHVETIIDILLKFNDKYIAYQLKNNIFGFNEIAKFAISLFKNNPALLAYYRNKTDEILVDEYQDTSILQETLLNMLSNNNLYMVGDIKQSIYRFRNASPEIFKNKYEAYKKENGGFAIDLSKNFRSREEVLTNINEIFGKVMDNRFGGVDYYPNHSLIYGLKDYKNFVTSDYNMRALTYSTDVIKEKDISNCEAEARIIAQDIREKLSQEIYVYDKKIKDKRRATYKDFVILTRNRTDYDTYRKIFEEYKIPLDIDASEDYLKSEEIYFFVHTLNLAYCLCNIEFKKEHYKESLLGFLRSFVINKYDDEIAKLILNSYSFKDTFNEEYIKIAHIANLIRTNTITDVCSAIIDEFDLYNKLVLVGDVNSKIAKINYFIKAARNIESFNLSFVDFLEYIEYLLNNKLDFDFNYDKKNVDSVSLLTMHKSKGLEYPYCYFTSLRSQINRNTNDSHYKFNEKYGIAIPYEENGLKDTVLKLLIEDEDNKEQISEAIRILYVAFTRAKEQFTIVMPEINDKDKDPSFSDKVSYKRYYDILQSVGSVISKYEVEVPIKNMLPPTDILSSDFSVNKITPKIITLDQKTKKIYKNIASTSMDGLISKEDQEKLDLGNSFHEMLEIITIKDYDKKIESLNLGTKVKKVLLDFYEHPFIKELDILNEYHELPFYYNGVNGIIDLCLETSDKFIIIDYKTSNLDHSEYQKQVTIYMDYIKSHTNKMVEGYLYSILLSKFKKIGE